MAGVTGISLDDSSFFSAFQYGNAFKKALTAVQKQEAKNLIAKALLDSYEAGTETANCAEKNARATQNLWNRTKTSTTVTSPTVTWPTQSIGAATCLLSGTKAANTSIWINGGQAVNTNGNTTWRATVNLATEGSNSFAVTAKNNDSPARRSTAVIGTITRDTDTATSGVAALVAAGIRAQLNDATWQQADEMLYSLGFRKESRRQYLSERITNRGTEEDITPAG